MSAEYLSPLLETKLYPPNLTPGTVVSRSRLLHKLDEAPLPRLVLISAPAGFGKSTLTGEWTAGLDCPRAWVTLEEQDNDPLQFWRYVLAALQQAFPEWQPVCRALLEAPQPASQMMAVTTLLNDLAHALEQRDRAILVLDDYQFITNPEIHAAVAYLIERLPPGMVVVIGSRVDPPLNLPRLRARRELREIRAADLRFSKQETADLLNDLLKLHLSDDILAQLLNRTEGWIAGLQLAALSLQGHPDPQRFVSDFAGDDRYIADYLIEEVFRRRPEQIQDFLLRTSVLERLSGPLCDHLLGRHDSQGMLEALEATNLFLIPLDNRREWYRYHRLFADLLKLRLVDAVGEEQLAALHQRASDWFSREGRFEDAVWHSMRAGDHIKVIELLEEVGGLFFASSKLSTLLGWIAVLPTEQVRTRPRLLMMQAWALLATGQMGQAQERLALLERLLGVEGKQLPEACKLPVTARSLESLTALVEITVMRANLAFHHFQFDEVLDQGKRALPYLTKGNPATLFNTPYELRPVVLFSMGLAYEFSGQMQEAMRCFEESLPLGEETGNYHILALALGHLAHVQLIMGKPERVEVTCQRALNLARGDADTPSPFAGLAHIFLGSLAYERNDIEAAEEDLARGIALAEPWHSWEILIPGYADLAWIAAQRGNFGRAHALIGELSSQIMQADAQNMEQAIAAQRARLYLAQGDLQAVSEWVEATGWRVDCPIHFLNEADALLFTRFLVASGDWQSAATMAARLEEGMRVAGRSGRLVNVLILQALICDAQDMEPQALAYIKEALSLAEQQRLARRFVDEGAPLARLLRKALHAGITPAYTSQILVMFPGEVLAVPSQPMLSEGFIEPLSERELDVLSLLAEGMTNNEIGDALFITLATVKTHTSNIYAKLQVNNRTAAVNKARALHLLPPL
jgi:LuxR family transcriptional regulator, maltose regulon positive regulatory protein